MACRIDGIARLILSSRSVSNVHGPLDQPSRSHEDEARDQEGGKGIAQWETEADGHESEKDRRHREKVRAFVSGESCYRGAARPGGDLSQKRRPTDLREWRRQGTRERSGSRLSGPGGPAAAWPRIGRAPVCHRRGPIDQCRTERQPQGASGNGRKNRRSSGGQLASEAKATTLARYCRRVKL
jgi:hypothetical protein